MKKKSQCKLKNLFKSKIRKEEWVKHKKEKTVITTLGLKNLLNFMRLFLS